MNEALAALQDQVDCLRRAVKDSPKDDCIEFAHETLWDIRNGIEGLDYTYQEVETVRNKVLKLLSIIHRRKE